MFTKFNYLQFLIGFLKMLCVFLDNGLAKPSFLQNKRIKYIKSLNIPRRSFLIKKNLKSDELKNVRQKHVPYYSRPTVHSSFVFRWF